LVTLFGTASKRIYSPLSKGALEMYAPLDSTEPAKWSDRRHGPPESRLRPTSRALRSAFALAAQLPRPLDAYSRAVAVRTLSRKSEIGIETSWGRFTTTKHDQYFMRPCFDEPLETAILARIVEPSSTVVDVGANRGWYTLLLSRLVGANGRVLSFEPDSRARTDLERNLAANAFATNVSVHAEALSAEPGQGTLVVERQSALSHLASNADSLPDETVGTQSVQIATLSEVLDAEVGGRCDLVKIDVEGVEALVLRGLRARLDAGVRPIVLVEAEPQHLARYKSNRLDVVNALGPGFVVHFVCWRHGRLEPFPGRVCDDGRNLLCLPEDRVDALLRRVFQPAPVSP
jgi:FkbM family methyltransferase